MSREPKFVNVYTRRMPDGAITSSGRPAHATKQKANQFYRLGHPRRKLVFYEEGIAIRRVALAKVTPKPGFKWWRGKIVPA